MSDLLDLLVLQDLVGTVGSAIATMDADLRLVLVGIPEDRSEGTGFATVAATKT
jgi:hypothetical protein